VTFHNSSCDNDDGNYDGDDNNNNNNYYYYYSVIDYWCAHATSIRPTA
jgi:hypothetical protein